MSTISSVSNLVVSIRQELTTQGYVVIRDPMTEQQFKRIVEKLGSIKREIDVTIEQQPTYKLQTNRPMSFHNDCYYKSIIGWYCVKQDETDGSTLLLDMSHMDERFTPFDLEILESIKIQVPDEPEQRLYSRSNKKLYFVPWAVKQPLQPNQTKVFDALQNLIKLEAQSAGISVRLSPGQVLFVDDSRVIHARPGLPANSPRLLKRVWIATQN